MNKQSDSPVGVGVITIMMILVVLSLSTFSALTLFSARADLKLSQVNANNVALYYEAENVANRLVAEFEQGLDDSLMEQIPISDRQELKIHLERAKDGGVKILEWSVGVIAQEELVAHLPIWGGEMP